MKEIFGTCDRSYPHFALIEGPYDKKQHINQQCGLDKYVTVINLETGERCCKKLYENTKGLHFKHTGYSPMYLSDFTTPITVYPFQYVISEATKDE